MALQVYVSDPLTTVDIDVALRTREAIPAADLIALGFEHTGSFDHSENFRSPDGIMVQFSAEPEWVGVVDRAEVHPALDREIRFFAPVDLVRAKLRAATDPARRRSKRLRDVGDIATLLEDVPGLGDQITAEERSRIREIVEAIDPAGPGARGRVASPPALCNS